MPFSAVTCLSYTGTTTLGGVLDIYSDIDGFTTPFKTNINLSAITGNQCPYYIDNVPDGSTIIKLHDILTDCCAVLPLTSNDLCTTANLDFNFYSASTVGRIIAGNLTGITNSSITDYRIYWYNTGNTTTPVFTSGKGTEYQPYSFTHPLTGSSAIFAPAGTYVPVIDKIKLSGLTFSQTGGTGLIPAELDCFDSTTVFVDYFKCDNGSTTSDNPLYSHRVNFLAAGAGITPQALYSDFLFTANTNYFAWKFKGFSIDDRLRLTYYAQAYNQPIIVEDLLIGNNVIQTDFRLSLLPKRARTSAFLCKVTCLTGITRTPGDYIRMEVIPNSANTQTIWDFYFTCLNTYTPHTLKETPYKLSLSSITTTTTSCNANIINYKVMINNPINVDDWYKYNSPPTDSYFGDSPTYSNYYYNDTFNNPFVNYGTTLYRDRILYSSYWTTYRGVGCGPNTTNNITFKKYVSGNTIGIIDIECNNITDFNAYYNSYLSASNGTTTQTGICATSSGPVSGTPYTPSDIRYYAYYQLNVPNTQGGTFCNADNVTNITYVFHTSTEVTTGFTNGNYTLRFTMPIMVNGLNYTSPTCDIQTNISSFVNSINLNSTGTSNNYTGTTTVGSRYVFPVTGILMACSGATSHTSSPSSGYQYQSKYLNETITYTGSTPTLAPSLTAITNHNFLTSGYTLVPNLINTTYYAKSVFSYRVTLNNPLDFREFEISGSTMTGASISSPILIYKYTPSTGGVVINPNFFAP